MIKRPYITQKEMIKILCEKYNLPKKKILLVLSSYFGENGLARAVRYQLPVKIKGFGSFRANSRGFALGENRYVRHKMQIAEDMVEINKRNRKS